MLTFRDEKTLNYTIYIYIYICMYNIYVNMYLCIRIRMCMHSKDIYIYIYVCVCVYMCVYVCIDNIKIWVSCKLQTKFQQKMCLVYHAQNCLLLGTDKTGSLNLLFSYHNCFLWILSQSRRSYFKNKCSSNLAVVYLVGFQGRYTGLGTELCIQLMKNS